MRVEAFGIASAKKIALLGKDYNFHFVARAMGLGVAHLRPPGEHLAEIQEVLLSNSAAVRLPQAKHAPHFDIVPKSGHSQSPSKATVRGCWAMFSFVHPMLSRAV